MKGPKPFYRRQTKAWYVQIGKKQHNLGKNKKEAWAKYHALMADRQDVEDDTTGPAYLLQNLDLLPQQPVDRHHCPHIGGVPSVMTAGGVHLFPFGL